MRRPPAVKSANLIHWWPLYQGAATDIIGTDDGTLVNSPVAAKGRIDECLDFESGSNQCVNLPNVYTSDSVSTTIAAWVNLESKTATQYIFAEHDNTSGGTASFQLGYSSGSDKFIFNVQDDAEVNQTVTGTTTPATDTWYFVAGTYDNSTDTIRLFVNAVEEGNNSTAQGAMTRNFSRIACRTFGTAPTTDSHFDGRIQDVMLWNATLTADELKAQMSIGTYPVMYQ